MPTSKLLRFCWDFVGAFAGFFWMFSGVLGVWNSGGNSEGEFLGISGGFMEYLWGILGVSVGYFQEVSN